MNPMSLLRPFAAFAFGATLLAGQGTPAQKSAAAPAPESAPPRPDGLKSRLFLLQYRAPDYHLVDLLRPLGSGNYWAGIQATDRDGIKAITVRDFPENIAAIEEAIKRLDVPTEARKQVEFHIHVLFASKQEGASAAVPDELKDVLASLKATLNYRGYTPVASFMQRAADGADFTEGTGQAEMALRTPKGEALLTVPIDLHWSIDHLSLAQSSGATTIAFPKFQLQAWEHVGTGRGAQLASVETNLTMKDGEKVVVGTSMIRDKAMIVVLTAKIVE